MDGSRDLELASDGPINPAALYNARHGAGAWERMRRADDARFLRRQAERERDPAKRAEMLATAKLWEEMTKC